MKTRKELKEAYKQRNSQMGVFQILNTQNGCVLIDFSTDVHAKWNRHQAQLRFGSHRNKALQKDWLQFGEPAFTFTLLSEIEHKSEGSANYNKELEILKELVLEEYEAGTFFY